ncbi:hypothetical protein HDU97_003119 [Phlyctochytrium planicorne]|nr:hypothetical protein HDU97_003070 [Phlyctochytrium planicorne]KAJ3109690.1 hypothetical protein HDU97_003119 [Phlyctochytrium planicorne]
MSSSRLNFLVLALWAALMVAAIGPVQPAHAEGIIPISIMENKLDQQQQVPLTPDDASLKASSDDQTPLVHLSRRTRTKKQKNGGQHNANFQAKKQQAPKEERKKTALTKDERRQKWESQNQRQRQVDPARQQQKQWREAEKRQQERQAIDEHREKYKHKKNVQRRINRTKDQDTRAAKAAGTYVSQNLQQNRDVHGIAGGANMARWDPKRRTKIGCCLKHDVQRIKDRLSNDPRVRVGGGTNRKTTVLANGRIVDVDLKPHRGQDRLTENDVQEYKGGRYLNEQKQLESKLNALGSRGGREDKRKKDQNDVYTLRGRLGQRR